MRSADEIWNEAVSKQSAHGLEAVRNYAIEQAQREAIEEAARTAETAAIEPHGFKSTRVSIAKAIRDLPHREGQ